MYQPRGDWICYYYEDSVSGNKTKGHMETTVMVSTNGVIHVPADMPFGLIHSLNYKRFRRDKNQTILIRYYRGVRYDAHSPAATFINTCHVKKKHPFVHVLFQTEKHIYFKDMGTTLSSAYKDLTSSQSSIFIQLCDIMFWLKDHHFYYNDLHIKNICIRMYKKPRKHELYSKPNTFITTSFRIVIIDIDDIDFWDDQKHDDNKVRHNIFTVLDNLKITQTKVQKITGLKRTVIPDTMSLSMLFEKAIAQNEK